MRLEHISQDEANALSVILNELGAGAVLAASTSSPVPCGPSNLRGGSTLSRSGGNGRLVISATRKCRAG